MIIIILQQNLSTENCKLHERTHIISHSCIPAGVQPICRRRLQRLCSCRPGCVAATRNRTDGRTDGLIHDRRRRSVWPLLQLMRQAGRAASLTLSSLCFMHKRLNVGRRGSPASPPSSAQGTLLPLTYLALKCNAAASVCVLARCGG